jgi:hypothetical protein
MANPPKYPYPSVYGSHKSMVVADTEPLAKELAELKSHAEPTKEQAKRIAQLQQCLQACEDSKCCICVDEFGEYATEISRLDNGVADPKRYQEARLDKLFAGKKEKIEK